MSTPDSMRAVVLDGVQQFGVRDVPLPTAGSGEVVVRLHAAALNHRDVWIKHGQYAGLKFPITPGSDGAGVVDRVGPDVPAEWVGREVIINPGFDWGNDPRVQSDKFKILGLPKDGTMAEELSIPVANLRPKPSHLDWPQAAALPLAGLTAWRALFSRAQLRAGEKLLITGIGGGVALAGLQFAEAYGARVWVSSSSPEKLERAREMGAVGIINYHDPDWATKLQKEAGLFDVILDSAGGPDFPKLVDLAAPGGRIVFYGATRGEPPTMPQRKMFWRQISLLGSTMGNAGEFAAMVSFVEQTKIVPVVSATYPLAQAAEAFELMERGGQFGKIALTM